MNTAESSEYFKCMVCFPASHVSEIAQYAYVLPPPAPLPFFSVLFFVRCKFATFFFFFFFGLVWFYLEEGAAWELLFVFPPGGLACMFPNVQTTFPPPCPAPLPFIPSCFRPFEVLVCCWIFFFSLYK